MQTDFDSERDSGVSTVDAAQSRDAAVYEALRDDIGRYATAAAGPGAATDIVVNAMRRVTAPQPLATISQPRRDLFQAVLEESRAHLGRRPAAEAAEDSRSRQSPPVLGQSPESLALDPEVRQAVLALSPRQRAAAYLTYWQECSAEETADLMGCRPGMAKRYLGRADRRLRKTLGHDADYRGTFQEVFDTVVEHVPPTLDWPDLHARVIQAPPLRRSPRPRLIGWATGRWVWALAAAVIVVAIVGGAALLLTGEGEDAAPVIAQPEVSTTLPAPATTLPAVTTTAPTMLPAPFPMSWEVVEGAGIKDLAGSVIVDENGWVAAGVEGLAEISGDPEAVGWAAAFWISVDGIDWERIPHDDGVFGNADDFAVAMDVTAGGPGYVAVGYAIDREGYDLTRGAEWIRYQMGSEYIDASVWLSEDGRLWSRVESAGLGGPGWQMLNGVTAAGPGLVAVGFRQDVGSGVWTSVDGSEWQAVEPSPFEKGSNVWGVYSDSQGLLAVGNIDLQPAIWSSEDGVSWEASRLTPEGADIRGETQAVVRMGDTIIGAGFAAEDPEMGEHVAGIWVSNDSGATWDQVPPFTSTVRVTDIFGLASTPQGLVIGGMVYDWGDPDWARAGLWVSVDDGTTWQAVPNEDDLLTDGAVFEVVVFEEKVFAFGSKRDGSGGKGAAWIGEWTN